MIRPATIEDIPQIVSMGRAFLSSTPYREALVENIDQIAATSRFLIESDQGVIFVVDEQDGLSGMIGMLLFRHHFSGELVAGELVWWMDHEHRGTGVRLLKQAEQWAARNGAQRIQMIAPNEDVGRIYQRLGYAPIETAYQRTL